MNRKPLMPEDRAYLREVLASGAAMRWMGELIARRPGINGSTTEATAMSAREALGYEKAVQMMAALVEEPREHPELKSVQIRED